MSITILPYIADMPKASATSNQKTNLDNKTGTGKQTGISTNFQTALDLAMKATAALAIDRLVKASEEGSVNKELVQQFFDQNNIAITLSPSNRSNTESATSSTVDNSEVTNSNIKDAGISNDTSISNDTDTSNNTSNTANVANVRLSNANDASNNKGVLSNNTYDEYFKEAAEKYNVSMKLLKSIAYCESNFQPNEVSHSGAVGIMQLMPGTAAYLGVTDSYDPHQNILGGAKLISQMLDKYNGDLTLSLAAYNAGSGNVERYGGVPPFTETQNYVKKVTALYNS